MNRIMVIGCGGAGKSTFSTELHKITGIELIHLDQHYWLPNWVELDKRDWREKVIQFSEKDRWIIDGNYGGTMEIRFNRADTVIFMDRSRWLCLYRVMKRLITNYGKTRKDMGNGCKERFSWEFMVYAFNYNNTRRPKILKQLDQLKADKKVIILSNNKEIKGYLAEMRKGVQHDQNERAYSNQNGI